MCKDVLTDYETGLHALQPEALLKTLTHYKMKSTTKDFV